MTQIYLNGEFIRKEEAKISVYDHGLLYGDGVFEGVKAYNGYIFKLDEHIERLYKSAHAIKLKIPLTKSEMKRKIVETVRKNSLQDAYIRPIITRGTGRLGISPENCESPTVIILIEPLNPVFSEETYQEGLKAIITTVRNQPPEGLPPTVKSLNYLTNIMARIQATTFSCHEAIMVDIRGNVSEGSVDNLFIVNDDTVCTPPVSNNLPGITRKSVIELALELSYTVSQEHFGVSALYGADEVFLTGTAAEIAPVVEIDGRKIGKGVPGPVTSKLRDQFAKITGIPGTGEAIYD